MSHCDFSLNRCWKKKNTWCLERFQTWRESSVRTANLNSRLEEIKRIPYKTRKSYWFSSLSENIFMVLTSKAWDGPDGIPQSIPFNPERIPREPACPERFNIVGLSFSILTSKRVPLLVDNMKWMGFNDQRIEKLAKIPCKLPLNWFFRQFEVL